MKKFLNHYILTLLASLLCLGFSANAQSSEEPAITIKTNAYANNGALNEFTLLIGANTKGQYVDVDCGFGKVEYELKEALYDSENSGIDGTAISCTVSKEGVVKIYCENPEVIDYINADGCSITEIDLSKVTKLGILSMNHNELKALDLTPNVNLKAIYLSDNEFTEATPLIIGKDKPNLTILEVSIVKYMDKAFNLSDYPNMMSFDAYHNEALTSVDPTGCPKLLRLSLDVTNIKSIDVSKNPELLILNVSDTGVKELDLSNNTKLQQLYCSHESGSYNTDAKIEKLDLRNNPALIYLFCSNNKLTELDVTSCTDLMKIYANNNYITSLNLRNNAALFTVKIQQNCMDFTTLPLDPGTWDEYEYDQRPMPVDKSYPEGGVIDLSKRVIVDGLDTYCTLYYVSEQSPGFYTPVEDSYYTYNNGKITLNKALPDSLMLGFTNDAFPNITLYTTKFMVKDAASYGKPSKLLYFSPASYSGTLSFALGVAGATPENPKEVLIDFGNGEKQAFAITESEPATANVTGERNGYSAVAIYGADGIELTTFAIEGTQMYSFDASASASLTTLKVVNAGLYTINLERNRCLKCLDLTGNNLSTFTLIGPSEYYSKNFLTDLNLSHNAITGIEFNTLAMLRRVDLSHNKLEALDFSDADYIEDLNISDNLFTELNFMHCTALRKLDFSSNKVTRIIEPEENNIEVLDLSRNNFSLATLPLYSQITESNYTYAPQNELKMATKGPCADLSEQLRSIDGMNTIFTWKDADGNTLAEGTDYTIANGITRFLDPVIGKMLHCEMSHPAFPDFAGDNVYKTSVIEAAGMPSNVVATFVTTQADETVSLSLAAAKEGTAIYFDWNGDGNVTQYTLGTTYRLFDAKTCGKRTVNVCTYDESEAVTVFNMRGASLSSFDGSNLKKATTINVGDAGLSAITLPESSTLIELMLDGNNFTEFDLSKYQSLVLISLNGNKLTTIDLSTNPNLQLASIANNELTDIKLNNPAIWQLYLNGNRFESIDLAGAPRLQQLTLADNLLRTINVEPLTKLIALAIDHNYFTFNTLPPVKPTYMVYQYHDQAPVEVTPVVGVIDLSDQAVVNGTETIYTWYLDEPYYNEEGVLEGEELYEGTEYTIENGVTTFLKTFNNVMCVMTNRQFPELTLYTPLMDISEVGVEGVAANGGISVTVIGNSIAIEAQAGEKVALVGVNGAVLRSATTAEGTTTLSDIAAGTYIVTVGGKAFKVAVTQ